VIGGQVAVDDVGQVPLEAAAGLLGRLGLGDLALVVRLSGTGVADLVQGSVELAVATPMQPMPAQIAAGGFNRGGAGVAGEVVTVGKRVMSPAWPTSLAASTGPIP
jgi:hypothetical protein